ncbi:MAG: maleylpyruvate isomerase N-terminal domain-containing protein [Acidobacteriaceae bacterium]
MNIISFFKSLKPEDWAKKTSEKWTVKDVLAHLVGWEREVATTLPKSWETKTEPWFMATGNYQDFNQRVYKEFKDYPPEKLLAELEKWEEILKTEIEKIGADKIRQRPHMSWVFDEGDEPHFGHHVQQVINVLFPHSKK